MPGQYEMDFSVITINPLLMSPQMYTPTTSWGDE